jgi:hypothetical protein
MAVMTGAGFQKAAGEMLARVPHLLCFIRQEVDSLADTGGDCRDALHLELALFSIYAAAYGAAVCLEGENTGPAGEFAREYRERVMQALAREGAGTAISEEEMQVRDFFYGRLSARYPKTHFFVTQSVGFMAGQALGRGQDPARLRPAISALGRAAFFIFRQCMDTFGCGGTGGAMSF